MSWNDDHMNHVLNELNTAYTRYDTTQPMLFGITLAEWLDLLKYLVNEGKVDAWQADDNTIVARRVER